MLLRVTTLLIASLALSACGSGTAPNKSEAEQPQAQQSPVKNAAGYSNISNAQLEALQKEGVTVVDIRRPEEWQQTGVVKGSKLLTLFNGAGQLQPAFLNNIKQIAPPDKPVILICRTGNRTMAGSQLLSQHLGYKDVYNVTNGITHWIAQGKPVVRPK